VAIKHIVLIYLSKSVLILWHCSSIDKYYRVDLQTKHIDYVNPPYPRSIGKYWLGCKEKDMSEKR